MRRVPSAPRPDALDVVRAEGLTYASERNTAGEDVPYWTEHVCYAFESEDIDVLEQVTQELHEMSVAAGRSMAERPDVLRRLGLPSSAWPAIRASLEDPSAWSLYGRFDLVWDGTGAPKLLEYNADTPAGLVEAAVSQWSWLEAVRPEDDQWNMLHERLVRAWRRHVPPGSTVHFTAGREEPLEDWNTVTYLRDTATEAGLHTVAVDIEEVGWHTGAFQFVDAAEDPMAVVFKMYPWEWMLAEEFGQHAVSRASRTRWVEPVWKVLLGSKALLPVLWELYPGHPNLLPAYFDGPRDLSAYVHKPMYGWEGAGISIHGGGETIASPVGHTAGQQGIYQELVHLPLFDGTHPVLGTWVVDGRAAGLGIRESTGLITDANAQFVPHYIAAPRSSAEQVAGWLAEDDAGMPAAPRGAGVPDSRGAGSATTPQDTPGPHEPPRYATFRVPDHDHDHDPKPQGPQ
jgi:glutathionylspermidine synthase